MTLREQRCLFTRLISELVAWIYAELPGYEVAYGEIERSKLQAAKNASLGIGITNSLHGDGLAADLHLYINGEYQVGTEAHRKIGEKWKSMHSLNRWGGDFKDSNGISKPDGNHYSSERGGRK